ncbi:MAG TPA: TauD/TfdA family dioxygenase [Microthrixaceae bacterium]|nr:TauD/TfdA family dioxygenase [Microthrixaceae bacterium]HMS12186.1 TauD/TfdA family dioxygenase [Microthrixaceae bacterium]HMT24769.1 TauD/TfdA family dioxygenase [Microthrixaceae bacterium]HMT60527.1 TauD/TfdA family dioxygenase [Microthrixaceae bacterium]
MHTGLDTAQATLNRPVPVVAIDAASARAWLGAGCPLDSAGPLDGAALSDSPAALALVLVRHGGSPITAIDPDDPLTVTSHLVARAVPTERDAEGAIEIEADDWVELAPTDAPLPPHVRALVTLGTAIVGLDVTTPRGRVTVIGSQSVVTDRWIATGGTPRLMAAALGSPDPERTADAIRLARPGGGHAHSPIPAVSARPAPALSAAAPAAMTPGSPAFVRAASHAARLLDADVHDALVDAVDDPAGPGALLVRGLPVGDIGPTPASPTEPCAKDRVSEFVLLTVARRLGQPVGYLPEHGGDIVQNLVPVRADSDRQTSTSSSVDLEFHTETAFHRHRPRFLVLLCLRGDPAAATTLCSIDEVIAELPLGVVAALRQPRFRTRADESFVGRRPERVSAPVPVLSGDPAHPTFTFDADLMEGTDDDAAAALEALRHVVRERHVAVTLEAGDLLVVDNARAVHGRRAFPARFDGTDRWLQRAFVVADLAPSAAERDGRVVTTRFAA